MTLRRALVLCGLLATPAQADFIDTTWTVTAFMGEAWFVDPDTLTGATQTFEAGYAEGAFYACDFAGQSASYTTYDPAAFLANPEFAGFTTLEDARLTGAGTIFVHRITCEGQGDPAARRVLYPFVTTDGRDVAFYPFEGGIFTLEPDR